MVFTCSKTFHFCYAHRLLGYAGKCASLHGHNGTATVTFEVMKLDGQGMVVDFDTIKNSVGLWISYNWDHNFLHHPDDPLGSSVRSLQQEGKRPYKMIWGKNPTAENMTLELAMVIQQMKWPEGVVLTHILVNETEDCSASCFPRGNYGKIIDGNKQTETGETSNGSS